MSTAILTIVSGPDYEKIFEISGPLIKDYADRIGAISLIANNENIHPVFKSGLQAFPHWKKFLIHDLLDYYDRILYLDADLIIRPDTPDLFALIPETHLGLFEEGKYEDRRGAMKAMTDANPDLQFDWSQWDNCYYNTGVMVISKCHQSLFSPPKQIISDCFFEQTFLNIRIAKQRFPVFHLNYRFNHMSLMDRFGYDKSTSKIIHYAGWHQRTTVDGVITEMKKDMELFRQESL